MEILFVVAAVAWFLVRNIDKLSAGSTKKNTAAAISKLKKMEKQEKQQPTPIPAVRKEKRAQMAQGERWRAAKQQQDDAEQLHAIHIDSCESKLESLRVLHEAGILDKEEYAERVLRTKARHARGEMRD